MSKLKRRAARLARMAFLCAKAKLAAMARQVKPKLSAMWRKSKAVAMSLMVAASLSLPAFATGTGNESSGSLTSIVSATDTVTSMINKAWTVMTSNELLRVYVAAGLLSVGIGFFGYLKRQSRH